MTAIRFAALVFRAAVAAMAAATRLVWKAGKWTLESFFPRPPSAAAETAHLIDEALSAPTATPAKAPEPVVDAALDWGHIIKNFAVAHMQRCEEPSLAGLDESAEAWTRSLSTLDLARIAKMPPRTIGEHVLGTQRIQGLPRCLSQHEYDEQLVLALTPGTREFNRLQAQPDELAEGVELLREAGKLGEYRGV